MTNVKIQNKFKIPWPAEISSQGRQISKLKFCYLSFVLCHYFVICALSFVITGCTPISISEEQKKQILAVDADFAKVLELKNELDVQLQGLRAQFLSEKNIYESKVNALRREFEAKRALVYSQAQLIKGQLEPQREKIRQEIAILSEELKNKLKSQQAIKGMLNQAKAIIDGKFSTNLSQEDKVQWQKRFESLTEEAAKVAQEIALVREKLYILKLKLRSLIQ